MKHLSIVLCILFFILKTNAQSAAEKRLGTWYMYNGSNTISEKLAIKTAAHVRTFEFITEYQQEIYRTGLTYSFSKKFNATGGMVYSITERAYKTTTNKLYEYRIYEDFNLKILWLTLALKHRVRLEHSFRANNEIKNRIRYGLTLQHQLFKNWDFYVFDEIFINFENESFGQNRIGSGFINSIDKNIKLRLGYMHIQFSERAFNRLQLGIILNTDFTKKTS